MNFRKVVKWISPGEVKQDEESIPDLKAGEILLKVESCGICGSDLKIIRNGNPRVATGQIIGHEISGLVVKNNGAEGFKQGDRLSVGADVPCGSCYYCNNGMANCCEINYAIGHQFEGGFSEYMILNDLTLRLGPVRKLKESTSYDAAALAEPLACCINGYERAQREDFNTVVIFGAGPIGLMLGSLAPLYGAKKIIMIDPNNDRLNRSRNMNLASEILNPFEVDVVSAVMDMTNGGGADLVFTANAVKKTQSLGIQVLGRRGVINLFGGLPKNSGTIELDTNHIHYREAVITGSHGSTPAQHQRALQMIEENKINHAAFITHKYPLSDFEKAYQVAASGDAIKVMIKPHELV